jgi:hypothetical protein
LVPPKLKQDVEASASTPATAPEPVRAVVAAPEPPKLTSAPARAALKPIARAQSAKPTSRIAKGPHDAEPLSDTPATVMAMRLLNARVAELDAKVQRLERALEGDDAISLP